MLYTKVSEVNSNGEERIMPRDIIYPNFITRYKGWYIYGARSQRDIPYKVMKKGRRTFYAESIRDIRTDIDKKVR